MSLNRATVGILCLALAWFVLVGAGARLCHSFEPATWSVYPLPIQEWGFGRHTLIVCGFDRPGRIDIFDLGCLAIQRSAPVR